MTQTLRYAATVGMLVVASGQPIDSEGRMYGLSGAGVEIFDPQGAHPGIIPMSCGGLDCQGVAFGGTDKKTLYVAGHGELFRIAMLAQGFMGRAK